MHYFLFLVLFLCFFGYLLSGVYILLKDRTSDLNWIFFFLCLETGLWAFGYAMMIIAPSMEVANGYRLISAFGWCFFASSWFDFAVFIAKVEKKYKRRIRRIIIYALSMFFYFATARYSADKVVVHHSFGYCEHTPVDMVSNLFIIYYVSFVLLSLWIIHEWGKHATLNREKKQAKVIVATTLVVILISMITDTILPIIGLDSFQLGIVTVSIALLGIWRSITKYQMMTITTKYVSDHIFRGVNNPIFFVDRALNLIVANDIALEMSGYSVEDMTPSLFKDIIEYNRINIPLLVQEGSVNREVVFIRKDGTKLEFIMSGTLIYDDFNDNLGIVIILQDVSQQKEAQKLLMNYNTELETKIAERTIKLQKSNQILKDEIAERKLAQEKIFFLGYYDELTGLPNRRFFNEHIASRIDAAKNSEATLALIFLDIDDFKFVNDTYGHLAGDELLKQLAGRLVIVKKESDFLARIGGDEFIFLIDASTIEEDIYTYVKGITDNILNTIKEPILINGQENFVTTSVGVAFYPLDGEDVDTLIINADMTMYEAKSIKKNCVLLCTPEIKNRMQEKTKLRNDLYRALEREELKVYYQPQVYAPTGQVVGYEALLRWHYKKEWFISPLEFIPLAEETGLMVPIGYWVLRTVCKDYRDLKALYSKPLCVAVNLSKNQLMEADFVQRVMEILKAYELTPDCIEFEITERIAIKEHPEIYQRLSEFKSLGFRISVDDFGTEYSSYMNLKNLPIDKIKIAMEFIQGSTNNRVDAAVVKSIIELSHELRLDVIAEGVETREQLDMLQRRGCHEVQGYYFYKPMNVEGLMKVLLSK